MAYDHMRLIGLAARAAAAAGKPFDADNLPRELMQARMVVMATPLTCGAETIAPETITLADSRGNAPSSTGKAGGDKVAELASGLPPVRDAVAVVYSVPNLITGARTTIHGAFEFTDAAIESLKGWRFEPSRINGARLYQPEKVMVIVK